MKCPHCLVEVHVSWNLKALDSDNEGFWHVAHATCPACDRLVIHLGTLDKAYPPGFRVIDAAIRGYVLVRPKASARASLSADVPPDLARDYKQGCLVLADSAMASAALSRRCLQNLLRGYANVKPGNLDKEIQQVLDSGSLPTYLSDAIDAVRVLGNFAAHPMKSTNTGEVIEVESGEAEWLLDTLEGLFDFYFVQPASLKKKREALNAKLTDAGKPPLK
jgi:hypothetical protein